MEWQPIETAPKNPAGEVSGPAILVWNAHNHVIYHAFWSTGIVNSQLRTGWFVWSSGGPVYPITPNGKVTHWMPLPEPPA